MKIFIIAFIVLQIVVIVQVVLNIYQTFQIRELTYRINCLEHGHLYTKGLEFCGTKVLETVAGVNFMVK